MWKTIKLLLNDALWADKVGKIFTILAAFASISGIPITYFIQHDELFSTFRRWWWIIVIGCLIILLLRILWVSSKIINQYRFSEKSSFTPVKLVKKINELSSYLNQFTEGKKQLGQVIDDICNKLREIFDKITNSDCCVSVKIIEGNENGNFNIPLDEILNHKVFNFGHDINHKSRRETEEYNATNHYIRENTAFSTIVGKLFRGSKNPYYLNNDVNIENSYLTTSPYKDENGNPTNPPYKSELVFPIIRLDNENGYSFLGFLCIDSEITGVFKKDDVVFEISLMYANILYELFPSCK